MFNDVEGNINFCPSCRKLIDSILATYQPEQTKSGLYIEVNPEEAAPPNHISIPLCDTCRVTVCEKAGIIDGFIVVFP